MELAQDLLLVLGEVPEDTRIAEKLREVALGQYQIEMVGAVGLLGDGNAAVSASGIFKGMTSH
ncbi:hypothetical protein [Desertibaculum subflavum]|uniref:hypothetical protein n=1 Tax=Desertibaculum subflavum TaxID=2268458 RepID=UPI000E676067